MVTRSSNLPHKISRMDWRSLGATIHGVAKEVDMTELLNSHTKKRGK